MYWINVFISILNKKSNNNNNNSNSDSNDNNNINKNHSSFQSFSMIHPWWVWLILIKQEPFIGGVGSLSKPSPITRGHGNWGQVGKMTQQNLIWQVTENVRKFQINHVFSKTFIVEPPLLLSLLPPGQSYFCI